MNQEPVFRQISSALLDHLRGELSPGVLGAPDMIQLGYPGQEADFRLGLYLYEAAEVRHNGPPAPTRPGAEIRRFPDLVLAMHFMAFANRNVAFNSMEMEDELLLIEGVFRAVHGASALKLDGQTVRPALHPLAASEKTALWQGMNAPLQPAVYFTLEPVLVPSTRIERVPRVREVQIHTTDKKRRPPPQ